jgi:D-aspartate ligase
LSKRVSALLGSGSASGTLAAVRNLGTNGVEVAVISSERLSAAAWSRWGSRSYSAPPETDSDRFLERLLTIGKANPGQILLATSDQTAWLYAANADLLSKYFRVYQPSLETVRSILDKQKFADAASKAELAVLPSWYPGDDKELEALAPDLPYPILIKPRTHVHRLRNDKGVVVRSVDQLIRQYRLFLDREQYRAESNPIAPDANRPILQQFVNVGREGVLSVTGFLDRARRHFVIRHAIKVFQRTPPLGVGVCFESLPPNAVLSNAVRRLCDGLGYFGIFEVEFLWFNGTWAVIDFNPRLYNQVGLDIRRGMPLPLLACLDAAGDEAALRIAITKAQAEESNAAVFRDRFTLRAILLALAATSRISRQDYAFWRAWTNKNAACAVDAAVDSTDRMPGLIHALSEISLGLKAVPRFLRSTPRRLPSAGARS